MSGWQSKVVHAASGLHRHEAGKLDHTILPSTNVIYTVAIHAYSDNYTDHLLNVFLFREHKSTLTCLRFFFCLYFTLWFNTPFAWPDDCLFITLKIYYEDCKQGVCCNYNLFDNKVTETTSQCTLFSGRTLISWVVHEHLFAAWRLKQVTVSKCSFDDHGLLEFSHVPTCCLIDHNCQINRPNIEYKLFISHPLLARLPFLYVALITLIKRQRLFGVSRSINKLTSWAEPWNRRGKWEANGDILCGCN